MIKSILKITDTTKDEQMKPKKNEIDMNYQFKLKTNRNYHEQEQGYHPPKPSNCQTVQCFTENDLNFEKWKFSFDKTSTVKRKKITILINIRGKKTLNFIILKGHIGPFIPPFEHKT